MAPRLFVFVLILVISASGAGNPGPVRIKISPANFTMFSGNTAQFAGSKIFFRATLNVAAVNATWSSSNQSAATIDAAGIATGQGSGDTTITARLGPFTGVTNLRVIACVSDSNCNAGKICASGKCIVGNCHTGADCLSGICVGFQCQGPAHGPQAAITACRLDHHSDRLDLGVAVAFTEYRVLGTEYCSY